MCFGNAPNVLAARAGKASCDPNPCCWCVASRAQLASANALTQHPFPIFCGRAPLNFWMSLQKVSFFMSQRSTVFGSAYDNDVAGAVHHSFCKPGLLWACDCPPFKNMDSINLIYPYLTMLFWLCCKAMVQKWKLAVQRMVKRSCHFIISCPSTYSESKHPGTNNRVPSFLRKCQVALVARIRNACETAGKLISVDVALHWGDSHPLSAQSLAGTSTICLGHSHESPSAGWAYVAPPFSTRCRSCRCSFTFVAISVKQVMFWNLAENSFLGSLPKRLRSYKNSSCKRRL